MNDDNAITTHALTRRFGSKTAVSELDLAVPTGSIFAFLGPNGAGKTTTIKLLMNILHPTAGEGTLLGCPITRLTPAIMATIGYVSENQKMPDWMTVSGLLDYCKPWYPTWDDAFCARLLDQFDLPPDRKLRNLSRGMRTKAALLTSLAYRPRVLILDEPFSGLDPLVREEFIQGVLELTEQEQWTVFISSHDIDEVERLVNWVGIINDGKLALAESVERLQARFRKVEVVLADDPGERPALPPDCLLPEMAGRTLRFVDAAANTPAREAALQQSLPPRATLTLHRMSLRDIFLVLARRFRLQERGGDA